jgi:DNA-binding beta-propeller fold protein YncE
VFGAGRALAHESVEHLKPPVDALAVTDAVKTGTGTNVYESVPNWCKMPDAERKTLGATHGGIVVDKKGNIYFSMDSGDKAILVYAPDGKFLRAFGDKLTGCHGLCINEENGEEFIYAAHLKGPQAIKFKLDGTIVWTLEMPKESGKYTDVKQYKPTGIAVGPNGDIYVADGYGQNWVHQWDKDRKYIRSFGGKGKEPGQFQTCHGIALDKRGEKPLLLICDRENKRLQHFDLDGKFVAVITENLRRPCSVSFHGKRVAIAELQARVAIIDETNKVVSVIGDNPDEKLWAKFPAKPEEWKEGFFTAPHGVSFDHDGNLYVMDWNQSGRVSKLNWLKQTALAK